MSYIVFARKYRPQRFDQVVAQDHVTKTLTNALKNDRIGSGYLFCGPRGTGKTTVARILAKCVNCAEGIEKAPCGECPSCKEIVSGSSLDVLEIDAASNTGVDDIRTIRENVRYLPASGKKRIYIIDEVHRLSGSAFDALLKTLEEPPPHVMFIFATTEPLKIPETILSRTQRYDFKRVSVEELATHLKFIADKDGLKIDEAALNVLARKADGSVRDSLSLLDQIAAFSSDRITEEEVVKALGLVDRQFMLDYVAAVADSDRGKVLKLTQKVFDGGIDVADFVNELLEHLRLLMIISSDDKAGRDLGLNEKELDGLKAQASLFEIGDILRLIKVAGKVSNDLKSGIDERLLLEVAGVQMAEMESTVLISELLATLKSGQPLPARSVTFQKKKPEPVAPVERAVVETAPPESPPVPNQEYDREQAAPPQPAVPDKKHTGQINRHSVEAGWGSFLKKLQKLNPMLPSQLQMAEVHSVDNNVIKLMFFASGQTCKELVSSKDNFSLILKTARDHFECNLSIKLAIDLNNERTEKAESRVSSNQTSPVSQVVESDLIKSLIEKIDGEIVATKKIK